MQRMAFLPPIAVKLSFYLPGQTKAWKYAQKHLASHPEAEETFEVSLRRREVARCEIAWRQSRPVCTFPTTILRAYQNGAFAYNGCIVHDD